MQTISCDTIPLDYIIASFYTKGLSEEEQKSVRDIADKTFAGAKQRFSECQKRCTFFAEPGYFALSKVLEGRTDASNPRIEGDDANPFAQHYWVSFDIGNNGNSRAVIIDPIIGYVGLAEHAHDLFNSHFKERYARRRNVPPNTAAWEGGVRIKTMGV